MSRQASPAFDRVTPGGTGRLVGRGGGGKRVFDFRLDLVPPSRRLSAADAYRCVAWDGPTDVAAACDQSLGNAVAPWWAPASWCSSIHALHVDRHHLGSDCPKPAATRFSPSSWSTCPPVSGLLIAAILAATMGTHNSTISALASSMTPISRLTG
jgi:hypothetical protein